jgi:hypothetical protein
MPTFRQQHIYKNLLNAAVTGSELFVCLQQQYWVCLYVTDPVLVVGTFWSCKQRYLTNRWSQKQPTEKVNCYVMHIQTCPQVNDKNSRFATEMGLCVSQMRKHT